jgi:hypothetical protein
MTQTNFQNVEVTMIDETTDKTVVTLIDILNIAVPNYSATLNFEHDVIATNLETQKKCITEWIRNKANVVDETIYTLVSWKLV